MKKNTIKNNIELCWALLCESSALDRDTNAISLFKVLEEITFEIKDRKDKIVSFPFRHELVSYWTRESVDLYAEKTLLFEFCDPNNEVLLKVESKLIFEDKKKNMRLFAKLDTIPVTSSGMYTHRISSLSEGGKFEQVAKVNLYINVRNV